MCQTSETIGIVILSYLFAVPMSCLFEQPVMILEKLLFGSGHSTPKAQNVAPKTPPEKSAENGWVSDRTPPPEYQLDPPSTSGSNGSIARPDWQIRAA